MKDRNRPIDGVVSGPCLSLDAVTDYAQRLAEQESFTVSCTTIYREMKQANIKLKKVRNDVSRFKIEDKFANLPCNLTLWGLINSMITTVVSLDRKSKYQIGSDQNR